MSQGWMRDAACRGLGETMFPHRGDRAGLHLAREVCRSCPVLDSCRQLAEKISPADGVWAGRRYGRGG